MNRYGWHYPGFVFRKNTNRVAIIGDSFIDALQISRQEHMGVRLQQLLETRCPCKYDVIATGYSGKGPQHYLEILKYDKEHFAIDTAIIVHFSGNDFRNANRKLEQYNNTDLYFAYNLAPDGTLSLSDEDRRNSRRFRHFLDANHKPLSYYRLINIAESYLLLNRVLDKIVQSFSPRRFRHSRQPEAAKGALPRQAA